MIRTFLFSGLGGLMLAGCQAEGPVAEVGRLAEPPLRSERADPPPGAPAGSCWGKDVSPAVIETVTEQVLLQPAQVADDGTVHAPAIFKTETRQQIVRERKELWFETPCPAVMDAGFVSSLQRALKARKLYRGAVSGEMDGPTRRAVRRYQAAQGLDSSILSIAAARQLGLVAYPRAGDAPADN